MRVAFTGAGATGKTTLAMMVKEQYDLPFITGVSRQCFQSLGLTEEAQYQMAPDQRLALQLKIFAKYQEQKIGLVSYVSDRTALDHYAHILYRGGDFLTSEQIEELEDRVLRDLYQHHMIVFCPTGLIKPLEDTFWDKTPANRVVIDALIRGFLERWNITHYVVSKGTAEQRFDLLRHGLERSKKKAAQK